MIDEKEFEKLKNDVIYIKDFLEKNLNFNAQKYLDLKKHLSNIFLKVKDIKTIYDINGNPKITIEYEIEPVELTFDRETNEPNVNKTFVAINMLDLISLEDMEKIRDTIMKLFL